MAKMANTLEQLNASYEAQLNGSQQQAETMQAMYAGITELMTNLSDSVEDTKKYKENISELSTNLSALNNVYGNMLTAMKS
jgi:gliding motility-associated protein GldL